MNTDSGSRQSLDSLSPTSSRADFNFPRRGSHASHRPAQRRGSTTGSIHSVGGSLDTSSGTWGSAVFESGQNAISTLLQPPIVRTGLLPYHSAPASSAHKPPTSRDIPPVALTNIQHVDAAEFQPYLSQVGPLYEHLRRLKESEEDAASVLNRRNGRPDEVADAIDDGHLRPGKRPGARRKGSTASISSLSSVEAPGPVRRGSGFSSRKSLAHGPPPLSTIPNVYFEEDFHLENPRTFDVVSERSEVVRPAPGTMDEQASNGSAAAPRKALATNAILQEKLSWYMDTIEMHLIQSISTASTTFFTALGALRELHSEAAESVDRIRALRGELEALDHEVATTGLNLIQQRRRRENLQQLHNAVLQLREVANSVAACEALVDRGDIEQALDGIDDLEMLIAGESGASHNGPPGMQLRDLRGAVALQGVSSDLDTLRMRIGMAYEAKFLDILMGDIRRHTEEVAIPETVDVAQDKIVKLLKVRSEQSSHLGLVWFLRYFALNLHFANECESISGRSGSSLKTVVNGQIKDFVQQHGDKEKQRLAQEMESDQWGARDFTDNDQKLLGEILESSTQDAPTWQEGTQIWLPYSDSDEEANGHNEPARPNGVSKTKIRSAVVDGESYSLPNSAVLCMHGMAHFLHLIVGISSITTDVSTSLISYLQLFNSRCTQLILGAGATRSAGLKNITTKHLALASQALGFIAALVPYVREFVRRHCGSGAAVSSVMGEFDKVRRLYQEHQNSIYDKLVEIMSGRALIGAKKMKNIDWDGDSNGAVHDYMETLTKETTTLHRNLTRHLPESTVRLIMLPVFRSYKETFGTALMAVEPRTEAGRDSMLRDIEHFETRLRDLDGFEDAGEYLRGIVKSKEVAQPDPAPAPSPVADEPEEKTADKAEEMKPDEADQVPEPAKESESNGYAEPKTSEDTAPKPAQEGTA
ncbi:Vps54-domain-containing protein [Coniochaeta hoffmannii]|uniref:Vacuolar protein sorting-associated protein 54 n=1 Tax=Coniochaeta hoffmannii TaxID=91930 RepID=A0AA38VXG4_9PEZI|nr:Vps54-domain-containing protein [Coniochaeta hoffmannii]